MSQQNQTTTDGSMTRIAVLVPFRSQWGRGVVQGICDYARTHCNWLLTAFDIQARSRRNRLELPHFDAVFSALKPDTRLVLPGPKARVVAVSDRTRPADMRIIPDERQAGTMAADYLLEVGLRDLAVFTFEDSARIDAFCQRLESRNIPCARREADPQWISTMLDFEGDKLGKLADWLTSLPKPAGIFTLNDRSASVVLQAARVAQISVPDQLAVLGCDADERLCQTTTPALSSVNMNYERVGRRAAEALDYWFKTGNKPFEQETVAPIGVIQRGSTDVVAHSDDAVAKAVRYIREYAGEGLSVEDVIARTNVSRRTLEKRFRQHVGDSIAGMIRKDRTAKAYRMLEETNLSITRIAAATGFAGVSQLGRALKRRYGKTPTQLRQATSAPDA
jgi:LacI family transcriptional regulator